MKKNYDRLLLQAKTYLAAKNEDITAKVGYKYGEIVVNNGTTEPKIGDTIYLKGYLSTFGGTDRDNDTVLAGAFTKTLQSQSKFPLLLNHENETHCQCGSFTAKEDSKGLFIEADFLVTENNRHEARLIIAKHLFTTSMGGIFLYSKSPDEANRNVIYEVILYEGSIVSIPANPEALIEVSTEKEPVDYNVEPPQVSNAIKINLIKEKLKGV